MGDYTKDFDGWNELKKVINGNSWRPKFKAGDIWWCAVGENIGVEMNGKNERFSRPVVILKKYNNLSFFGLPMTTKVRKEKEYIPIFYRQKCSYVVLRQGRTLSALRLYRKMGSLSEYDFNLIRDCFLRYIIEIDY